MQNPSDFDEFDLSAGQDSRERNNNVYVVSEENLELVEEKEKVAAAAKPYSQYDPRVINLLRGKPVADTKSASDVQEKLFKLLSINEFDQAIVNISYYYDLKKIVPVSAFGSFKIFGLESIGLRFNRSDFTIEGVPQHLDCFQVGIQFNLKGNPFSKLLTLNVITLWKEVDPPADSLFPKSNDDSSVLIADEYKKSGLKNVVAASKRGRSHAYDGKFRDDDFAIEYNAENQWYAVAVCDGAGSSRYSREGSRILAGFISEIFRDAFRDDELNRIVDNSLKTFYIDGDAEELETTLKQRIAQIIKSVLVKTLNQFKKTAQNIEKADIGSFSTTCLLSVFKKTQHGWLVFSYNVGDGAIGMVDMEHRTAAILCNPDEGKYFGQTRFITTEGITAIEDIRSRIVFKLVKDFDALILMTDGISDPKFESDKNLNDSRCWVKFYENLRNEVGLFGCNDEIEQQMLEYLDFWSIGNHDDRTIVVVF